MTNDSLCYMVGHIGSILSIGKGASKAALSINLQVEIVWMMAPLRDIGTLLTTRQLCSLGNEAHAIDK